MFWPICHTHASFVCHICTKSWQSVHLMRSFCVRACEWLKSFIFKRLIFDCSHWFFARIKLLHLECFDFYDLSNLSNYLKVNWIRNYVFIIFEPNYIFVFMHIAVCLFCLLRDFITILYVLWTSEIIFAKYAKHFALFADYN